MKPSLKLAAAVAIVFAAAAAWADPGDIELGNDLSKVPFGFAWVEVPSGNKDLGPDGGEAIPYYKLGYPREPMSSTGSCDGYSGPGKVMFSPATKSEPARHLLCERAGSVRHQLRPVRNA